MQRLCCRTFYFYQPLRFSCLSNVFVENQDGELTCYSIENMREHKNRAILKFSGVSNIGEAESLAGQVLLLPIAEFESTPDGNYYHFDIVGFSVRNLNQELIGAAEKVLSTGGTDVVVVRQINGKELLLPFCRDPRPTIGQSDAAATDNDPGQYHVHWRHAYQDFSDQTGNSLADLQSDRHDPHPVRHPVPADHLELAAPNCRGPASYLDATVLE